MISVSFYNTLTKPTAMEAQAAGGSRRGFADMPQRAFEMTAGRLCCDAWRAVLQKVTVGCVKGDGWHAKRSPFAWQKVTFHKAFCSLLVYNVLTSKETSMLLPVGLSVYVAWIACFPLPER